MLPNGKVADILSPVLDEMWKWIQNDAEKPESGGYIVGYHHSKTGNISLENISSPYSDDEKNRYFFKLCDLRHKMFLLKVRKQESYYMGVWHTHPQPVPIPSNIDWNDWNETLKCDKTGCQYIFFVIAGTKDFRIWIGNIHTGKIIEGYECAKDGNGIYIR